MSHFHFQHKEARREINSTALKQELILRSVTVSDRTDYLFVPRKKKKCILPELHRESKARRLLRGNQLQMFNDVM